MTKSNKISLLLIFCLLYLLPNGITHQRHSFIKTVVYQNYSNNSFSNSYQSKVTCSKTGDATQLRSTQFLSHSFLINTPLTTTGSAVTIRGFLDAIFISVFETLLLKNMYTSSIFYNLPSRRQQALTLIFPYHSFW